jgi:hypothetical protein
MHFAPFRSLIIWEVHFVTNGSWKVTSCFNKVMHASRCTADIGENTMLAENCFPILPMFATWSLHTISSSDPWKFTRRADTMKTTRQSSRPQVHVCEAQKRTSTAVACSGSCWAGRNSWVVLGISWYDGTSPVSQGGICSCTCTFALPQNTRSHDFLSGLRVQCRMVDWLNNWKRFGKKQT